MPSWFVPLESKLQIPPRRPGFVQRPRLIEQLQSGASPLVLVTAPPGYGKTTLLQQWSESDERPFAWVTVDDTDNDASQLLAYIVFALQSVIPLRPAVLPRSPEPGPGFTAFALPRLSRALAAPPMPFTLVIDDAHLLEAAESLDVLSLIVQNFPPGSQLVLAGRHLPALPLSRLLVNRSLLTLGVRQLAMSPYEGAQLLHLAGLPVGGSEARMLVERTEGWPAGLFLAALALREQRNLAPALHAFAGSDGLVADYLRDELLDQLPREWVRFSLGTAALGNLSGPLCDAVLGRTGSAAILAQHARKNMFLTPVDRDGVWYRRHQLWAEMLLAELRRRNPSAERVQHRRAATWFDERGDTDAALHHARLAEDYAFAAEIVARHLVEYLASGRAGTLRRWIESLPTRALADLPWFGAAAAHAYIANGDVEHATYWVAVAERGSRDDGVNSADDASLRSAIAIARASLGLRGLEQIQKDATVGYEMEPEGSQWKGLCAFLQGVSMHLRGDRSGGMDKLREAIARTAFQEPNVHAWSMAQLAMCEMADDDWDAARELAESARIEVERHGLQDDVAASLVYAVSAMTCVRSRQPAEARRDAAKAARLLSLLSGLAPWISIEGSIIIAYVYLALGDPGQAREILRPAEREFTRLRDAPLLKERFDETLRAITAQRERGNGAPPLTPAEIRILQFLPTHLSFREIAQRLHVSRNTVKTQVIAVYRKLGVENRAAAVESAEAMGIIEVAPAAHGG